MDFIVLFLKSKRKNNYTPTKQDKRELHNFME